MPNNTTPSAAAVRCAEEWEKQCDPYVGPDDVKLLSVMIDAFIREAQKPLEDENYQLRKMLWLNHDCPFPAFYGDDGEMQCGNCLVDFKRSTPEQIRRLWELASQHQICVST